MKIVIGEQETRVVPITSTQPLNGDKTTLVKFNAEIEISDSDEWREITERWDTLGRKLKQERHALDRGLDYDPPTDEERMEANSPAIDSIKHLLKDVAIDVEDQDGMALQGADKINHLVKIPWLKGDLFDAIVAVQSGKTVEAYKKLRAKN